MGYGCVEELTKFTLASWLVCGKEGSARFAVDPAQYRVVCVVAAARDSGHNDVRARVCRARVVVE